MLSHDFLRIFLHVTSIGCNKYIYPKEETQTEERILNNAHIREFAAYWVREEKRTATCEKYLRDVRCFARFAGEQIVTKETVVAWKKELVEQGYAVRSINSMLASGSNLFAFPGWHERKVKNIRIQRQT